MHRPKKNCMNAHLHINGTPYPSLRALLTICMLRWNIRPWSPTKLHVHQYLTWACMKRKGLKFSNLCNFHRLVINGTMSEGVVTKSVEFRLTCNENLIKLTTSRSIEDLAVDSPSSPPVLHYVTDTFSSRYGWRSSCCPGWRTWSGKVDGPVLKQLNYAGIFLLSYWVVDLGQIAFDLEKVFWRLEVKVNSLV